MRSWLYSKQPSVFPIYVNIKHYIKKIPRKHRSKKHYDQSLYLKGGILLTWNFRTFKRAISKICQTTKQTNKKYPPKKTTNQTNNNNHKTNKQTNKKEGNVLFNDALNTFYLRLYGVRLMVQHHPESERGNPLSPLKVFPISSKDSFICITPQTG